MAFERYFNPSRNLAPDTRHKSGLSFAARLQAVDPLLDILRFPAISKLHNQIGNTQSIAAFYGPNLHLRFA